MTSARTCPRPSIEDRNGPFIRSPIEIEKNERLAKGTPDRIMSKSFCYCWILNYNLPETRTTMDQTNDIVMEMMWTRQVKRNKQPEKQFEMIRARFAAHFYVSIERIECRLPSGDCDRAAIKIRFRGERQLFSVCGVCRVCSVVGCWRTKQLLSHNRNLISTCSAKKHLQNQSLAKRSWQTAKFVFIVFCAVCGVRQSECGARRPFNSFWLQSQLEHLTRFIGFRHEILRCLAKEKKIIYFFDEIEW